VSNSVASVLVFSPYVTDQLASYKLYYTDKQISLLSITREFWCQLDVFDSFGWRCCGIFGVICQYQTEWL